MSSERVGDYFYEDCRAFLSKFKNKKSIRFDAFAEVWQEMKFSFMLTPWKYLGEMQEIVEEYLKVCKTIWLKSELVEERVCGLYLLRAIYLKQPAAQYVKISLSHEDWQWMKHFLFLIKDFVQNEPRYVLQELFELNAFTISVPDCTPTEGKDDGGFSESVMAQFAEAHTLYDDMFSALQQENDEYNEQRRACMRVYPELRSFNNAETDSLVDQLMEKLELFEEEVSKIREDLQQPRGTPGSSLHEDDTASEETDGRTLVKRRVVQNRSKMNIDCCEPEESSDSEDDSTFLNMPQIDSEDSDGEEDETSCTVSTVRTDEKADAHISDFEISSGSLGDYEGPSTRSTGSGDSSQATVVEEAAGSAPSRMPPPRRGMRRSTRSSR